MNPEIKDKLKEYKDEAAIIGTGTAAGSTIGFKRAGLPGAIAGAAVGTLVGTNSSSAIDKAKRNLEHSIKANEDKKAVRGALIGGLAGLPTYLIGKKRIDKLASKYAKHLVESKKGSIGKAIQRKLAEKRLAKKIQEVENKAITRSLLGAGVGGAGTYILSSENTEACKMLSIQAQESLKRKDTRLAKNIEVKAFDVRKFKTLGEAIRARRNPKVANLKQYIADLKKPSQFDDMATVKEAKKSFLSKAISDLKALKK